MTIQSSGAFVDDRCANEQQLLEGCLDRAFVVIDPEGEGTIVDATFMGGDMYRVVLSGGEGGIETIQVCAEDRNGNLGCDADVGGGCHITSVIR